MSVTKFVDFHIKFGDHTQRGLDKVGGEWRLVCLAWNVKRMAVLRP